MYNEDYESETEEELVVKKGLLRVTCALMVLLSLLLTACGGSDKDGDDPNLGVYTAKSAQMSGFDIDVEDVFDGGFTIELKKKGKGEAKIGDEEANIKWTLEGTTFHAKGGGVELDGKLKGGIMMLEDVMGSGVTLVLECEEAKAAAASSGKGKDDAANASNGGKDISDHGKSGSGESGASQIAALLNGGSAEEVGDWDLYTVTQDGKAYMKNDLRAKGISSKIHIDADGTGQIELAGSVMDMEWGNGQIVVPENEEGERDEYRYSLADDYLVLVDGDMVLAFERVGGKSGTASDDSPAAEISEALMAKYEGDWHGIILFSNAKGSTFADRDGKKCDVAARIALDENGNVTPYFAEAKDEDTEYNFRNMEAELDPDMDYMYISGNLLTGKIDTAAVGEENGLLHSFFTITADNGDTIDAEFAMRHPDVPWQSDDYPMYPKEGFDYYKGKSLEQVLADFGTMPAGLPGKTNITGWE